MGPGPHPSRRFFSARERQRHDRTASRRRHGDVLAALLARGKRRGVPKRLVRLELTRQQLAARMTEAVGVPVIDGVAAATKTVEGLVAMGLRTSARAEFGPPLPKAYTGLLSDFQIGKPDIC